LGNARRGLARDPHVNAKSNNQKKRRGGIGLVRKKGKTFSQGTARTQPKAGDIRKMKGAAGGSLEGKRAKQPTRWTPGSRPGGLSFLIAKKYPVLGKKIKTAKSAG